MTRFLGLLLLIGSFLLVGQCAFDHLRGETAIRRDRGSPPGVIDRSSQAAEFNRAMAGHWLVAIMPALAGCFLLSRARRQESEDMFSPEFKGIEVLEEAEKTVTTEEADETPPPKARISAPLSLPAGRILSVLICLAYVVGVLVTGAAALGDMALIYLVLAGCLVLIWFPDDIGDATGYFVGHHGLVDRPTPRILIACAGWFFLVGLPVLLWFLSR